MLPGKVPPDVLDRIVFAHLGKKDKDLLLGPSIGEDASLIRVGEVVIVAATDPITGSVEDIGWLAVHINANDVATFGVRPRWFLASIMLPTGFQEDDLERIMSQIHEAALSLDITVAGGHTEITDGIDRPIVAGFMMGVTTEGSYVTSAGAKPGNAIMMSKTAAIEGTAILATEGSSLLAPLISKQTVENAISLRSQISVVEDGVIAFETGHITAMHDPTEGGLLGGIHEICDASQVGFELD
ncbi:MAG: AIR synthase related protein, partial [Candidatus Thorarchaeota archaeon]